MIVAAIALLVLVIVTLILSGGGRELSRAADGCNANGGRCVADITRLPDNGDGWVVRSDLSCGDQGEGQVEVCYVYEDFA